MKWINEEKDKIIDANEKSTFDEIIKCYENALYRAGYILCWILLIESIKRKLHELDRAGDSVALKIVESIEAEEKAKKSTDRLIYESGKSCGLYDETELAVIEHLWGRRCFYSHPYESKPSQKELEYIIEKSVEIVLSREVLYNKQRLEDVCKDIVLPHLLNNDKNDINNYAQRILSRTPIKLFPFFFKSLLFIIKDYINTTESWIVFRLRALMVNIIIDPHSDLSSKDWDFLDKRMVDYPEECIYGFISPQTWDKLPDSIKDKAINYVKTCADQSKQLILIGKIFVVIEKEGKLSALHKEAYYKILKGNDIEQSHNYYNDKDTLIAILETIIEGGIFTEQNKVIDIFKYQSQSFDDYTPEQKIRLGRLFEQAARMGCWKAIGYVDHFCTLPIGESDDIKTGIVYNTVLKKDNTVQTLLSHRVNVLLKAVKNIDQAEEVIENISAAFDGKTSFDFLNLEKDAINKAVDAVVVDNPYAEQIRGILCAYYTSE